MPALFVAAAVAATLSATAAPAATAVKQPPARTAAIQKICGMPMVIGDASVDPGILVGASADRKADARRPEDGSGCGSVKLVKPVKRQR